ncbi:MAG TPA: glycosyltransferase [Bacteroidales bacterium]|jgi:glycosyltransferase involved in cell wall biosynthesis|nr:glycosyltransferase [Bacteroidales bacterium]
MPRSDDKIKAVFSVVNCICHDQRVLKIAGVVNDLGCNVTIIGRRKGDCCRESDLPFRTFRFRMLFNRGFLFYSFFNIRLFFYLLFHNYDVMIANDLDTLLPNFLVAVLKRRSLVYDSHEYFTGVPELTGRIFVTWVWKTIESYIFPRLKHVMTVSDSLALQYEKEYGIRPVTVRNCSVSSAGIEGYSGNETGIKAGDLLLIFQGGGINIDRGGEELVEAMRYTSGVSLIVAGSGDVIGRLKNRVLDLELADRILFLDMMPWEELMKYTRSADAGLSLDKDTNMNYRFSLPNKLFDYISAGIPVIAGNLPEVAGIIKKYDCGIIIPEITPEAIAEAVETLKNDRELLNKLRRNVVYASEDLSWEKESEKVKKFYERVFKEK